MYLKRKEINRKAHFILAESFYDGECWRSRDVMDLGSDPGTWIVYAGRNSFYFKGRLERGLHEKGVAYDDDEFDPDSVWREAVEDFISGHRLHRPPRRPAGLSAREREACRRMHITPEDFAGMDRNALIRCFRRRAKVVHPDQGGRAEAFVKLTEAYECLLLLKS